MTTAIEKSRKNDIEAADLAGIDPIPARFPQRLIHFSGMQCDGTIPIKFLMMHCYMYILYIFLNYIFEKGYDLLLVFL